VCVTHPTSRFIVGSWSLTRLTKLLKVIEKAIPNCSTYPVKRLRKLLLAGLPANRMVPLTSPVVFRPARQSTGHMLLQLYGRQAEKLYFQRPLKRYEGMFWNACQNGQAFLCVPCGQDPMASMLPPARSHVWGVGGGG